LRGGDNERSERGSESSNAFSDSEKAAQDPAQYSLPFLSVMKYTETTGIVNKIRPFTLVLFWMDKSIYGIYKLDHGHVAYFKLPPEIAANRSRQEILGLIHVEGDHPHPEDLGFDQFVAGIRGARVRKIWLTKMRGKTLDAVFLSTKELRHFLHHPHAQHDEFEASTVR